MSILMSIWSQYWHQNEWERFEIGGFFGGSQNILAWCWRVIGGFFCESSSFIGFFSLTGAQSAVRRHRRQEIPCFFCSLEWRWTESPAILVTDVRLWFFFTQGEEHLFPIVFFCVRSHHNFERFFFYNSFLVQSVFILQRTVGQVLFSAQALYSRDGGEFVKVWVAHVNLIFISYDSTYTWVKKNSACSSFKFPQKNSSRFR